MIPTGCVDKPFDGEMLGRPVWSLSAVEDAQAVVHAARAAGVGLIVYRGEARSGATLEQAGFRPVETLVTYSGPLPDPDRVAMPDEVRRATPEDAEAVAEIAARAFRFDRWHVDPEIPNARANAFKAAWARNAVLGRARAVLVANGAEGAQGPAGFNALMARDETLVVDLIAVAPAHQGAGIGGRLMQGALAYGATHGFSALRVGTQAGNGASVRLYSSLGLTEVGRAHTWHWTP